MTIYILHGWAYDTDKWSPFLKQLKKLGVSFKLLNIPGLTAPLSQVWQLKDYVKWLKTEAKSDQQIILLGHSNGGRIAAAFAAKYPHKVAKLILIDSAGIFHDSFYLKIKRQTFKTLAKIGKKLTQSSLLQKLLYWLAREQDYIRANPNLRKTMVNLISQDLTSTFKQITSPTLIIWGRHDQVTPYSDANLLNSLVNNSTLITIKTAKHSPHFTHPKSISKIIASFINNQ